MSQAVVVNSFNTTRQKVQLVSEYHIITVRILYRKTELHQKDPILTKHSIGV